MRRLSKVLGLLIVMVSCEPTEEQLSGPSSAELLFSNDTVLFDTLLTQQTSLTRRLRIYNPNDHAILINEISLGKGSVSPYGVIINGRQGPTLRDEVLNGGDSLMVLVNATIDPQDQNLPYLVKDSLIVTYNQYQPHVKLVAWGQDAVYLNGEVLCDQTFTADRPYVIYNFALVDSLCTLTIEKGARILLDNGSNFFIKGTLKVQGDTAEQVVFRNTRFDASYLEAPGQWGGIYFLEGSKANEVKHAVIENGSIGLRVGTPDDDDQDDLTISHSIIRHMSVAGLLAFTSDVSAVNTLIHNAGTYVVGNFAGGNYSYHHCTFTNQPGFFINDEPSIQFSDNIVLANNEVLAAPLTLSIQNSILWGPDGNQLLINAGGGADVKVGLQANIIRSEEVYEGNLTSMDNNFPGFTDPFIFDYTLDSLSPAIDRGVKLNIIDDIRGLQRDENPDIGAFERINQ